MWSDSSVSPLLYPTISYFILSHFITYITSNERKWFFKKFFVDILLFHGLTDCLYLNTRLRFVKYLIYYIKPVAVRYDFRTSSFIPFSCLILSFSHIFLTFLFSYFLVFRFIFLGGLRGGRWRWRGWSTTRRFRGGGGIRTHSAILSYKILSTKQHTLISINNIGN